jgi:hypothetical protein
MRPTPMAGRMSGRFGVLRDVGSHQGGVVGVQGALSHQASPGRPATTDRQRQRTGRLSWERVMANVAMFLAWTICCGFIGFCFGKVWR